MARLHNGKDSFDAYFWGNVYKSNSCWLWVGHTNKDGYGRLWMNKRLTMAHRVSLSLAGVVIPKDKEIDHLCRNRNCVNPQHLEIVTHKTNMERGVSRCSKKTCCKRGHPLSGNNLVVNPDKSRQCRICKTLGKDFMTN